MESLEEPPEPGLVAADLCQPLGRAGSRVLFARSRGDDLRRPRTTLRRILVEEQLVSFLSLQITGLSVRCFE